MSEDSSEETPQKPERPKNPLMNMFERWNAGSVEKPRDIADEERNGIFRKIENQEDIIRRLGAGFLEIMKEAELKRGLEFGRTEAEVNEELENGLGFGDTLDGKDYMVAMVYQMKQGYPDKPTEILPPEKRFITMSLFPTSDNLGTDRMPQATTPYGRMPAFFIGADGLRYQAKNEYVLNPHTGEAWKREEIWPNGDDTYYDFTMDESTLPRVDYEPDDVAKVFEHKADLLPEDIEQLDSLLERMRAGEIKYQPRIKPNNDGDR